MCLRELRVDCDGDTLLAIVEPLGPACHTGERSCFYRSLCGEADSTEATFLGRLWRYLNVRKDDDPKESYTARLLRSGLSRVAQKVGEEAVETVIEAVAKNREAMIYEASDLIYHLLVLLEATGCSIADLEKELARRHS